MVKYYHAKVKKDKGESKCRDFWYECYSGQIEMLTEICKENSRIDASLYPKYDVKRGLRDINGKGVLAGLTQISNIVSKKVIDGEEVPCEGELYYRGINVEDLTKGFLDEKRFGFEEATYLLLFGRLPNQEELKDFCRILATQRTLPTNFVPGRDYESAQQRYDEHSFQKCADSVFL